MKEIAAKSILSPKNNMNLYRGCTHGCIYCDSRSECYGMTYTFEDVQAKTNAPALLEQELRKRRQPAMITSGAMSDPYLPLENQLFLTQQSLLLMEKYGFGVSLLTKSDLILRDVELLQRIHHKTKCVVAMTLTTFDEDLCKKVEPHVCTTKRRFEVLRELHHAGIPTVVWMTPTLPFINDSIHNVNGLLSYCADAHVKGILTFGMGMTLRSGNREYFYAQLDRLFPSLKQQYMRSFGCSYGLKSPNANPLEKAIRQFCRKNKVLYGTKSVFEYATTLPPQGEQLSMW